MATLWTPEQSLPPLTIPNPHLEIADGRVLLDTRVHTVLVDHAPLSLKPTSLDMFMQLAAKPDRLLPYGELLQRYWPDFNTRRAMPWLSSHLASIRKGLGQELGDPLDGAVRTHKGLGIYAVSTLGPESTLGKDRDGTTYCLADGRVEVDISNGLLYVDGMRKDNISASGFRIFARMARSPGEVFSNNRLIATEWGAPTQKHKHSLKAVIYSLRLALGPELGNVTNGSMLNIRGKGYVALKYLDVPSVDFVG